MTDIFFKILSVLVAVTVCIFVLSLIYMIFISKITATLVGLSRTHKTLVDSIQIREVSGANEPILDFVYKPDSGNTESSQNVIVYDNNKIHFGEKRPDDQPGVNGLALAAPSNSVPSLLFMKGNVYTYNGLQLGEKIGELKNSKISYFSSALGAGENFFIIDATFVSPDRNTSKDYLFQVSRSDFSLKELTDNPYYGFVRPPKVFKSANSKDVVVVYYVGSWDFAFGGDASRPKFSIVRLYNDKYPEGTDIAQFGFRAGTIVDVRFENNKLLLIGDPSLPRQAHSDPLPSKVWEISFVDNRH